ncbi:MAG: hypothetical protein K8I01_09665 [Candidatus Methylomirabilis sp.]|nr:hypothetical protein [Deltaproteobacteria bacterium]
MALSIPVNGIPSGSASGQSLEWSGTIWVPRMSAGQSWPEVAYTGKTHYRTDRDIAYVRNSSGSWVPVQSFSGMEIFIDPETGIDDADHGFGPGSNAFASIQYAVDSIPGLLSGDVLVKLSNAAFAEDVALGGKYFAGPYTLTVRGEQAIELSETTATGGMSGNADNQGTLVKTGAGWTVNRFQNMWVRFSDDTSTAALRGQEYLIDTNTSDTLTICNTFQIGIRGTAIATPLNGEKFTIHKEGTRWGMGGSGQVYPIWVKPYQANVVFHRIGFRETVLTPPSYFIVCDVGSNVVMQACSDILSTRMLNIYAYTATLMLKDCYVFTDISGGRGVSALVGSTVDIEGTKVRGNGTAGNSWAVFCQQNATVRVLSGIYENCNRAFNMRFGGIGSFVGSPAIQGKPRVRSNSTGIFADTGAAFGVTTGVIFSGNTTDKNPSGAFDPAYID